MAQTADEPRFVAEITQLLEKISWRHESDSPVADEQDSLGKSDWYPTVERASRESLSGGAQRLARRIPKIVQLPPLLWAIRTISCHGC
jgi:hypothetical protein